MSRPTQPPRTTITVAGISQNVVADNILILDVLFEADLSNAGVIYIGDVNVSSTRGISLPAGHSVSFSIGEMQNTKETLNLKDFWADASVSGDKFRMTYLEREGT